MLDANESALNAHLNKEAAQERRAEAVESLAADMLKEGSDIFPFTHENIVEALCNTENGTMLSLTAQIYSAEQNPDNHVAQECVAFAIRKLCRDYWQAFALRRANEQYIELKKGY